MARHQSPAQKETVERVMHEYQHGELKTAHGNRKVESRSQAVAIALHEAGASRSESPQENARNLRRTKTKERRGETYRDEAEGRHSPKRRSEGKTRDELYAEARHRDIPGRSRMSKAELARALHH